MRQSSCLTLCATLTAILLSACSSVSLVNSWSDPSFASKPLRNIVVFSKNENPLTARTVQQKMVAALSQTTNVTPAYAIFKNTHDITDLPLPDVLSTLAQKGYDGLLMAGVTNITKTEHYSPPSVIGWGGLGWGGWSNYGWGGWGGVTTLPGYNYASTNYFVQGSLYATQGDSLVWSAQAETEDPTDTQKTITDIVQLLSSNLIAASMLAK